MKKRLVKILTAFTFTVSVFLIFPRQILATASFPYPGVTGVYNPYPGVTGVYNPVLPSKLSDTSGPAFLQNILQLGIKLGFVIGAIIFFFMLISGGIKWISSAGDKTRLEGAQKQITHALIGLAILLSIFAIIRLLDYIFGVNLLQINLPTL